MLHFIQDRRTLHRERLLRDRLNPLEKYDDVEIIGLFWFERHILRMTDELRPLEHRTGRNKALSPLHLLCASLRYAATSCMQTSIASYINVDKSTISRTVWQVAQSILEVHRDIFHIDARSAKDQPDSFYWFQTLSKAILIVSNDFGHFSDIFVAIFVVSNDLGQL